MASHPPYRLKIGLTMRTLDGRDALERSWAPFMAAAFPDAAWLPLPNTGDAGLATAWSLDALILTGGDDVGASACRDATERALLDHALAHGLPVFGVCRGLQLIQVYFGGELSRVEGHAGTTHAVGDREVNSYHHWGVHAPAAPLEAFARAADGLVEGLRHPSLPLAAVQWHPERGELHAADLALVREVLCAG
jgi:putative glutamine amidotransferase